MPQANCKMTNTDIEIIRELCQISGPSTLAIAIKESAIFIYSGVYSENDVELFFKEIKESANDNRMIMETIIGTTLLNKIINRP